MYASRDGCVELHINISDVEYEMLIDSTIDFDTALLKAYDKALNIHKKQLAGLCIHLTTLSIQEVINKRLSTLDSSLEYLESITKDIDNKNVKNAIEDTKHSLKKLENIFDSSYIKPTW